MSQTDSWSFISTPTYLQHNPNQSGSIKLPFDLSKSELAPEPANSAPWSTGYFAFPPGGVSARIEAPLPPKRNRSENKWHTTDSEPLTPPPPPQVKTPPESAALAAEGEREWVRAGGVLRDARGRVDRERTEAIKAVLEAENVAAVNRALWRAYEERWRILLRDHAQGATGVLHWEDVPWPTRKTTQRWSELQNQAKLKADSRARGPGQGMYIPPPDDLRSGKANRPHVVPSAGQPPATISPEIAEDMAPIQSITDEDIESFIYDPVSLDLPIPPATENLQHTEEAKLLICKSKAAHHRIRRELLHWHSDKFDNAVLSRVAEEGDERERVAEDAGRVWRWLSVQGARARTTEQE